MITLANTLKVADIEMNLAAETLPIATANLLNVLRHDKRVTNWAGLVDDMGATDICVAGALETNFCIPHARTRAVQTMVIAAGRCLEGIPTSNGSPARCHYVFVIGIPVAMDGDYLRLVGSIARAFHRPDLVKRLNGATTATELHQALSEAERVL